MPVVECCYLSDPKAFGRSNHGRIRATKWKVAIPGHELGDPQPIRRKHRFGEQVALGQIRNESHLCLGPQSSLQQIRDLSDDKSWNE
jgi:hypothetical protein